MESLSAEHELAATPAGAAIDDQLAAELGLRPGTRLSQLTSLWAAGPAPGPLGGGVLPELDLYEGFSDASLVPAWVALLGSDIERIREEATWKLRRAPVEGVPGKGRNSLAELLRAVRRSRMPVKARNAALFALSELGWYEIEPADRALLRRLIRIELAQPDVPAPVKFHDITWFAVSTSDQAAVLDAFGLCDPLPVTLRMGLGLLNTGWDWHHDQVFVSPVLNGWTLALSREFHVEDAGHLCEELSRRFGAAHHYTELTDTGSGEYTQWRVAESGVTVRTCGHAHEVPRIGPLDPVTGTAPTADELRVWIDQRGHHPNPPEPPFPGWEFAARTVAGRLSVCPRTLGPHTRVEGTGVIAAPKQTSFRRAGAFPLGGSTWSCEG
ncbi:hypothetical protein [Allokutzneria sp. NRRL B-24872]|uniref:hypothetical protein n=1 Tax=Allokutzneria sp. NRRL B-24872 TaxID=1137961 RepID=UPI000A3B4511|nr:hypothetical protein [Allokutzneria sp. NRRL B-24872]